MTWREDARVEEVLAQARKVFEEMAKLIDDALQELELVIAPLASSEEEAAALTSLRQFLGLAGQLFAEGASSLQKLAQGEASVEEVAARWEQMWQPLSKMAEPFAGEEMGEQEAFYLFTTAPRIWRCITYLPELADRLEAL
jgi:ABC-type transporter Mla subunit MlaD